MPMRKQPPTGSPNVSCLIDFQPIPIQYRVIHFYLDGDLGATGKAKECYLKQKHRMLWERRHGKIGSGMKNDQAEAPSEE
jgi:hypothetical protein